MSSAPKTGKLTGLEIAVIGMAGRFPGARDTHEFWHNLINGIESVSFLSDEEFTGLGIDPGLLENPHFVRTRGGVLEEKECFDGAFFDYTPREAEIMDPQLRVFHECAWQALEDAGYDTDSYQEPIGLFAGGSPSAYWEYLSYISGKTGSLGDFAASNLINKDYLTTRISYKLNLQGPAFSVQTACSTSLVAVHLACRALLTGECKLALAGGVSVWHQDRIGYVFQEGMISSPDGHCRAFDAQAMGVVGGDGVGLVVLKRLKEAMAERDHIYAVIKGSAVNNDGNRRVGFTAPSVKGQFEVIRAALRFSRVEPESITYVEAHGTGTPLGDPVEIEALKKAFNTDRKGGSAIGSVKTNIGHLDAAAGIAGFIKTVLALKHKKIPPSLHFEKPNPKIDFQNSWFYVNNGAREWETNGIPRRAGVSSFGQGGTNAHVILEEWTGIPGIPEEASAEADVKSGPQEPGRENYLVLLSAKTDSALEQITENFVEFLRQNPGVNLADAAYTLQVGRTAFKYRQKLICSGVQEAVEALTTSGSRQVQRFYVKARSKEVVFMFPGIGAQYVNMGLDLYEKEPEFRRQMDRCFEILEPLLEFDIKGILYPSLSTGNTGEDTNINRFEIAQPVTFIIEYSLATLLIKWGIKPHAMIGYSFGEYVAACLSGVFSLEDALKLVVWRGQLLRDLPAGGMMSVPLYEKDVKPLLTGDLAIAIDIGPSCIVSGPEADIAELEQRLKEKRLVGIRLKTSLALHSRMMQPICEAFEERVRQVKLNPPVIPYISNVTGQWITVSDAADPAYWTNHVQNTVRFDDGMKELIKEENAIFIEVGPSRDICTMIERYIDDASKQQAINLVRPQQSNVRDDYYLLSRIGSLWLYGVSIDWNGFYARQPRQRISLPLYPFAGQRYWMGRDPALQNAAPVPRGGGLRKKPNIDEWFYIPGWKTSGLPSLESRESQESPEKSSTVPDQDLAGQNPWLVLTDDRGIGVRFAGQLQQQGADVTVVKQGTAYERISDREFALNPQSANDYLLLFNQLGQLKRHPMYIVHFWGVSAPDTGVQEETANQKLTGEQESGFYSLVYLAKAIEKQDILHDIHLGVITAHVQEVTGGEVLYPEKALVLGALKVIPQEYPYIICRTVDIDLPQPGTWQEERLITRLMEELKARSLDTVIAYRHNRRWVQEYEPIRWSKPGPHVPRLKEKGVYLITGGLGNIGYLLAQHLVKTWKAKLVLTGRTPLPDRQAWDNWLETHNEDDAVSSKIKKIRSLEELGGQVLVFSVDVSDFQQMRAVISAAEQDLGPINGVIHAAGDTGQSLTCPVDQLDRNIVSRQFTPKIYGLLTIEKLFREKPLDFCLLTSSLSPILGGLGFAAYSAANVFMDAFVYRYNRTKPDNWISVNWADWRFTGEAVSETAFGASAAELSIAPAEGLQTFERILYHCRENQVVISSGDLGARIDQWVKLRSLREEKPAKKEETPLYQPRPDLESTYVMPSNKTEQSLAEVLQDFLGIEKVGIDDNFFEIGATSLNLIQINRQLRLKVGKDVPIVAWFEYPTIALLVKYLEKDKGTETVEAPADRSAVINQGKNKLKYLRRLSHEN